MRVVGSADLPISLCGPHGPFWVLTWACVFAFRFECFPEQVAAVDRPLVTQFAK